MAGDSNRSVVERHVNAWPDDYDVLGQLRHPDFGNPYFVIAILELRDGKVWRQSTYFAPPNDAPDWRAEWTERY